MSIPFSIDTYEHLVAHFEDGKHLRIHNRRLDDWTTVSGILDSLFTEVKATAYAFSIENPGQPTEHIHAIVPKTLDDTKLVLKAKERGIIQGNGNKYFSFAKIKNPGQIIKYISKERVPFLKNISADIIASLRIGSYKKDKEEYAKALSELENKWYSGHYFTRNERIAPDGLGGFHHTLDESEGWEQFIIEVIQLRLSFSYSITKSYIQTYLTKHYLKKFPNRIGSWLRDNDIEPPGFRLRRIY